MLNSEMIVDRTTVTMKQRLRAEPVNWGQWLCPNSFCTTDRLLVQHAPDQEDGWRVKEGINGQPWLVASTLPGCPFCGATLQLAAERSLVRSVIGHEGGE